MSARLFCVRRGLPLFRVSFLFSLLLFSSVAFSQTIDPAFKPLLQDFGSTQNRADAQISTLQPDGKIPVGGTDLPESNSALRVTRPLRRIMTATGKTDIAVFRSGVRY